MASSLPAQHDEEERSYTAAELILREQALEAEARAAIPFGLGACTYDRGYIKQPVYACRTCGGGGVCAHCSLGCHAEHDLVELFHRRRFRCDCGTSGMARLRTSADSDEAQVPPCQLRRPRFAPANDENRYSKNFQGEFCYCERGARYDPETEDEVRSFVR